MTESVLRLNHVAKSYGNFRAVEDLSFEVKTGTITGFLGPNGAGKTTALRMILDIVRPTSGAIEILGHRHAGQVRRRVGYLPEERGLYRKMTARGTIAYIGRLKGMSAKAANDRARQLLAEYGLKDFADSKIEALSKGMAQKVQVLTTVVHDPEFVILDEPFSGLDPVNQQVLEDLIADLKTAGRTILFSTHVMEHAERLCDQILLLSRGKLVFSGTIPEARRQLPMRVRVGTEASEDTLRALPGVASATPAPDEPDGIWDLFLDPGAEPQNLLRAFFERGIVLDRFDRSDPTMRDIFVHLVGPDAKEAVFR